MPMKRTQRAASRDDRSPGLSLHDATSLVRGLHAALERTKVEAQTLRRALETVAGLLGDALGVESTATSVTMTTRRTNSARKPQAAPDRRGELGLDGFVQEADLFGQTGELEAGDESEPVGFAASDEFVGESSTIARDQPPEVAPQALPDRELSSQSVLDLEDPFGG